MGNRAGRIRETRRRLKTFVKDQQTGSITNLDLSGLAAASGLNTRGSSVNASTRQSMLDVSMRSTEGEHSGMST